MKRYAAMVARLAKAGMDLNRAIEEVTEGYSLTTEQHAILTERVKQ